MRGLTREQKIFLKVTRAYVEEERPDLGFRLVFDVCSQPVIGSGSKIVDVSFHNAERLFQRIFQEGNMGLGEGYSEGLIEVKDEEYKEFLCICIYATSPRILRHLSIFDMIAVVRARWAGLLYQASAECHDGQPVFSQRLVVSDDIRIPSSTIGSIGIIACIRVGNGPGYQD